MGKTFQIMSFASETGTFSSYTGLMAGRTPLFSVSVNSTNVVVNSLENASDLAVDPNRTIGAVPAGGNAGITLNVSYTVNNLQDTPTWVSSWVDSVYLSAGTTLDSTAQLIGRVNHDGTVDGLGFYVGTLNATLPGAIPGNYHIIVACDSRGLVPDIDRSNNTAASTATFPVEIPSLTLGTAVTGTIADGQQVFYQITLPAGHDVEVTANFGAINAAELYAAYQVVPNSTTYNEYGFTLNQTQQSVLLAATQAGTYYILLNGQPGAGAGAPSA